MRADADGECDADHTRLRRANLVWAPNPGRVEMQLQAQVTVFDGVANTVQSDLQRSMRVFGAVVAAENFIRPGANA